MCADNKSLGLTDEEYQFLLDDIDQAIAEGNRKYGYGDGNSNGNGNNEEKDKRSVAKKLVDLISQNSNIFFKDQYDTPHVIIHNTDHYEIVRVENSKYKELFCCCSYCIFSKLDNSIAPVSPALRVHSFDIQLL